MKDRGRIDWMPRKQVWAVVAYKGRKDVRIAECSTREEAVSRLQQHVSSERGAVSASMLLALVPLALPAMFSAKILGHVAGVLGGAA